MKQRREFSFRERFRYWFDNQMSKGSLWLIRSLIAASLLLAILIAGVIILCGFQGDSDVGSVFWDSISTVINAWMPSYEDGSVGYIMLMAVTAIAGVLFTSVLIGIVTSTIEQKIIDLRRGDSKVLERDHIVILGFTPGEYTLLKELVLAAAEKPACVVVADDFDREEAETMIRDNIQMPKNFRIICRSVDILDPVDLQKCSIDTARTVLIHPMDDTKTVKAILAVSSLLEKKGVSDVRINAILSDGSYTYPASLAEKYHITVLCRNNTIAKMIAHSCTQTALSQTFIEVFNYEGNELYLIDLPDAIGLTFSELSLRLDHAVPVGVQTERGITLNPPLQTVIAQGDRILVFADEERDIRLLEEKISVEETEQLKIEEGDWTGATIIGYNSSLKTILCELPENVETVHLVLFDGERDCSELVPIARSRGIDLKIISVPSKRDVDLNGIASLSPHVILLSDHEKDAEEADMETVFLLLHLREIRKTHGLKFNITAEMNKESNQNLVADDDHTDFVVSSSMSALFLSQLCESPELKEVFREILSNDGSELYLRRVEDLGLCGKRSVAQLRADLLKNGCILLGYLNEQKNSTFNPPLTETLDLKPDDHLIVLSED